MNHVYFLYTNILWNNGCLQTKKFGTYHFSGDLNNIVKNGIYLINTYNADSWSNLPNNEGGINTLIVSNSSEVYMQTFIHHSGILYCRLNLNATWTEWKNTN